MDSIKKKGKSLWTGICMKWNSPRYSSVWVFLIKRHDASLHENSIFLAKYLLPIALIRFYLAIIYKGTLQVGTLTILSHLGTETTMINLNNLSNKANKRPVLLSAILPRGWSLTKRCLASYHFYWLPLGKSQLTTEQSSFTLTSASLLFLFASLPFVLVCSALLCSALLCSALLCYGCTQRARQFCGK